MSTVLERMKKINIPFLKSDIMDYNELAKLLAEVVDANIYILKCDGNVLGICTIPSMKCEHMESLISKREEEKTMEYFRFSPVREAVINLHYTDEICVVDKTTKCNKGERVRCMWPIYVHGEYRGVFLVTRMGSEDFSEDDIIVCEHAITCVSLVVMHVTEKEEAEAERKRQMVRMGFDTLSYSEMEAIGHVLMSMDRKEGLLVASKIADEAGITRSVIVNALRKLESAGLIATRSLGMKGTFIKVKNEFIFDELKVTK